MRVFGADRSTDLPSCFAETVGAFTLCQSLLKVAGFANFFAAKGATSAALSKQDVVANFEGAHGLRGRTLHVAIAKGTFGNTGPSQETVGQFNFAAQGTAGFFAVCICATGVDTDLEVWVAETCLALTREGFAWVASFSKLLGLAWPGAQAEVVHHRLHQRNTAYRPRDAVGCFGAHFRRWDAGVHGLVENIERVTNVACGTITQAGRANAQALFGDRITQVRGALSRESIQGIAAFACFQFANLFRLALRHRVVACKVDLANLQVWTVFVAAAGRSCSLQAGIRSGVADEGDSVTTLAVFAVTMRRAEGQTNRVPATFSAQTCLTICAQRACLAHSFLRANRATLFHWAHTRHKAHLTDFSTQAVPVVSTENRATCLQIVILAVDRDRYGGASIRILRAVRGQRAELAAAFGFGITEACLALWRLRGWIAELTQLSRP